MHEIVARAMAANGKRLAARISDRTLQGLTGIDSHELPGLLLGVEEIPTLAGARRPRDQLAALLGRRRAEASALLGASASRSRRNDYLVREMLDRAHAVIDTYVHVAAAIRPYYAARPGPGRAPPVRWQGHSGRASG